MLDKVFRAVDAEIGVKEPDVLQRRDIRVERLGIIGDNRAVIVVVPLVLVEVIGQAGVEDGVDPLLQQPFDMPVDQLRRVADGVGGDGIPAEVVGLPGGDGRNNDLKTELGEERMPERQVLDHVQPQRNADFAPRAFHRLQLPDQVQLVFIDIRQLFGVFDAEGLFALVAGDKPPAVREGVDRQRAVVGAPFAGDRFGGMGEVFQLFKGEDGRFLLPLCLAVEGGAKGPHQPRDVRADDIPADFPLKASQHRVVEEGAPLDNDVLAQFVGGVGADDLIDGVFDDARGRGRPRCRRPTRRPSGPA